MKIVITSETYFPKIGGAEVHVNNPYSKLKAEGHSVSLITNELSGQNDEIIRLAWSGRAIPKHFFCIWRESEGADVIHSHYSHRLAMLSGIVARLRGIPLVVTLHGMGILDLPHSGIQARVKHWIYRYTALKLATVVISTSDDLAIVADRYINRSKTRIIMNGYDADRFQKKSKSEDIINSLHLHNKKVILTLRRLVPKNGPHYLVEAMPKILKKVPSAHYVVVGDGQLREEMQKRVDELGIGDHVSFLGAIHNESVADYLSLADVVVFPSTAESSSIACAEAMGMGKLVVASRVGGLIELLGQNSERGYLVDLVPWTGSNYAAPKSLPDSSYANLAEGVVNALKDSEENATKRDKAYRYASTELSWDAILNKTIDVYSSVVKNKINLH